MIQIFLIALIAAICRSDRPFFGMMMFHRPLIVSTLVGLVCGDLKTGIIFGAQMELLSMGLVGIGSASGMPEITLGTALCTAFICRNGVSSELALTMALPISSFAAYLGYLTWTPLGHIMAERAKKAAKAADIRVMEICQWGGFLTTFILPFFVVFFGLLLGAPVFEYLLSIIPSWLAEGISDGSWMLPALGFALLMRLTFSWKMAPYLFIGFIASAFFQLSNVGIAMIGVVIAALIFANEKTAIGGVRDDNEI